MERSISERLSILEDMINKEFQKNNGANCILNAICDTLNIKLQERSMQLVNSMTVEELIEAKEHYEEEWRKSEKLRGISMGDVTEGSDELPAVRPVKVNKRKSSSNKSLKVTVP